MMKALLTTTGILEFLTGIALLAVPKAVASILLGGTLDTPASLVVARLAGAALLSLGAACWFGGRNTQSQVSFGIVAAMLFYNLAAVALLLYSRFGAGMAGVGLLPASALHTALAIWCIACLRNARACMFHMPAAGDRTGEMNQIEGCKGGKEG